MAEEVRINIEGSSRGFDRAADNAGDSLEQVRLRANAVARAAEHLSDKFGGLSRGFKIADMAAGAVSRAFSGIGITAGVAAKSVDKLGDQLNQAGGSLAGLTTKIAATTAQLGIMGATMGGHWAIRFCRRCWSGSSKYHGY